LVQKYIEAVPRSSKAPLAASEAALSRKRKSPGSDVPLPRDPMSGILTPQASTPHQLSRSASVVSTSSDEDGDDEDEVFVYNALLERKEGWIVAKPVCFTSTAFILGVNADEVQSPRARKVDATTLPTPAMKKVASSATTKEAGKAIRDAFYTKLQKLPKLYLENNVDSTTPSLDFKFIKKYVLGAEVYAAPPETYEREAMSAQHGPEHWLRVHVL